MMISDPNDNYKNDYTNERSKTASNSSDTLNGDVKPSSSMSKMTMTSLPVPHSRHLIFIPWSMPIQLFTFLFVMLTINCLSVTSAAAATVGEGTLVPIKGLLSAHMRFPKMEHIHVLQAVPESLAKNDSAEVANKTHHWLMAGKFEIRSVSGEPNYKSVNLTWEVEFVPSPQDTITNTSAEIEPPKAFQLYFCELQSFGPHRCRSKIVNGTSSQYDNNADNNLDDIEQIRKLRQYATQADNLRMATKYRFHIRSLPKQKQLKKVTGRSEAFENEIDAADDFLANSHVIGQTIVIPTKGFSAQATQCLPNASEIEVETGPNFGGKIVVDGGSCGIKGNPNDTKDKYTMRIDHKACGSMVKPETNTVETFITVQENLGIFTHSTRRFVVVCSYQSGLQTVRASFSVPGRGGATAVQNADSAAEDDRMGRGLRPFRYVDKSELILKEDDGYGTKPLPLHTPAEETEALVQEMYNPILDLNNKDAKANNDSFRRDVAGDDIDAANAVALLENIIPGVNEDDIKGRGYQQKLTYEEVEEMNKDNGKEEDGVEEDDAADRKGDSNERFSANFAKLILERNDHNQYQYGNDNDNGVHEEYMNKGMALIDDSTPTGSVFGSVLELISTNMGSVLLTIILSVILVGVLVLTLYREAQRPCLREMHPQIPSQMATLQRHQHLKETHTIPRTLRTKLQDILA